MVERGSTLSELYLACLMSARQKDFWDKESRQAYLEASAVLVKHGVPLTAKATVGTIHKESVRYRGSFQVSGHASPAEVFQEAFGKDDAARLYKLIIANPPAQYSSWSWLVKLPWMST